MTTTADLPDRYSTPTDLPGDDERRAAVRALVPTIERLREARDPVWPAPPVREGVVTLVGPQYDDDTLRIMVAFGGRPPLTDGNYGETLRGYGVEHPTAEAIAGADLALTCALLTATVRAERFCDGAVAGALEDGTLVALLDRLRLLTGV